MRLASAILSLFASWSFGADWRLNTPLPNASIPSAFIAATGAGPVDTCTALLVDKRAQEVCAGPDGRFERVIRVSPGSHNLQLADVAARFTSRPPSAAPSIPLRWELLRAADVILSLSRGSEQADLYGAMYSHAAAYLGPDRNGMAVLAEAVTESDAEGLGEVRSVPFEMSQPYKKAQNAVILRAPNLSSTDRDGVVRYLRGVVDRGLRYWSTGDDFSVLYSAWLLWDPDASRPRDEVRFQQVLRKLDEQNRTLDRFTCANLVWRAFLRGTNARLDLAAPHRGKIGGRLAGVFSDTFLARVAPFVITADSLYLSGKLREVSGE